MQQSGELGWDPGFTFCRLGPESSIASALPSGRDWRAHLDQPVTSERVRRLTTSRPAMVIVPVRGSLRAMEPVLRQFRTR
jgi:hypothetical protein